LTVSADGIGRYRGPMDQAKHFLGRGRYRAPKFRGAASPD